MMRPPPTSTLFPYTTLFRSMSDVYPEAMEAARLKMRDGALASDVHKAAARSEEHTSELQSRRDLVCRLLLEKKKMLRRLDDETRESRERLRLERSGATSGAP